MTFSAVVGPLSLKNLFAVVGRICRCWSPDQQRQLKKLQGKIYDFQRRHFQNENLF